MEFAGNVEKLDVESIWSKSTEVLKDQLDPQIFSAWIKPLSLQSNDAEAEDQISIVAPNKFCRDHVERHYGHVISSTLSDVSGRKALAVRFRSNENSVLQASLASRQADAGAKNSSASVNNPSVMKQSETTRFGPNRFNGSEKRSTPSRMTSYSDRSSRDLGSQSSNLNPDYNFSNFVIGSCNQFAHAASLRVAQAPGAFYNPLFIYGGVGLGKTHLANAIGNAAFRRGKRVLIVSSEVFVNELIHSLRSNNMQRFKSKFRSLDVLVIDDIQFLIGKERTQEEFFHTFNELHHRKKHIVLTSDTLPQELVGLEERLRTRFNSGLSADLQPPDFETRVAILSKKAELSGIALPEVVARLIADQIDTNIRELEGALNRIQAISTISGEPISVALAEQSLESLASIRTKEVSVESIQRVVAKHFNVGIGDLLGKRRTQNIAVARHVAMYLCRKLTARSYPEVGAVFGGRDHSTAIHACRKLEQRLKEDSSLVKELKALEAQIIG